MSTHGGRASPQGATRRPSRRCAVERAREHPRGCCSTAMPSGPRKGPHNPARTHLPKIPHQKSRLRDGVGKRTPRGRPVRCRVHCPHARAMAAPLGMASNFGLRAASDMRAVHAVRCRGTRRDLGPRHTLSTPRWLRLGALQGLCTRLGGQPGWERAAPAG